jgi:hypothetical protein
MVTGKPEKSPARTRALGTDVFRLALCRSEVRSKLAK